ncbi:MAG: FIST N-terminal domain-containing protein [Myxococcota bacterium]|nr:FIST N-terminal domain-containing protein [Myxococcota bacterium]
MKLAIAHTLDPDTAHAAEELIRIAREKLDGMRPSAGLLYTALDFDHAALIARLYEEFEGVALIGCTTDGELSGDTGFHEDSVVLILFASEQITIRAGLGRNLSADPFAAVQKAIDMATEPGDPTPSLCITLPDGLSSSGSTVTTALLERLGSTVPLVGGMAADQHQYKECWQLFNGEVVQDTVPLLLFYGPLSVGIGQGSGWKAVGQRVQVTEATGHIVRRIGNQTAVAFYQNYFGDQITLNPEYPLVVYEADRQTAYIRSPMMPLEGGAIQFAGDIPVGASVRIAEASRSAIIEACTESIHSALSSVQDQHPDGILVFSCAARRMVLGTRTFQEIEVLRQAAPPVPIGGFYSYGEIAPAQHGEAAQFHNETFITILLAETA